MERRDLYQDDLTEERQPGPAARADVADTQRLDPDVAAGDDIGQDEEAEDELND